jgi:predicted RNA binding protein YcfA (HicA-like mRNA interferase family)
MEHVFALSCGTNAKVTAPRTKKDLPLPTQRSILKQADLADH